MRRSRHADLAALCPACGSSDPEELLYSDTQDFRGLTLDLVGLRMSKCRNCGQKWSTSVQEESNSVLLKDAYAAERDRVRQEMGLLDGTEIERIRTAFGLTQKEASSIFGGGPKAFNKYENGEVLQSQAMDKLLRLTEHFGQAAVEVLRSPKRLEAQVPQGPENPVSVINFIRLIEVAGVRENQIANSPEVVRPAADTLNNLGILDRWETVLRPDADPRLVPH